MERSFERDFRALGEIFDFADGFTGALGLNQSLKNSVNIIVEELFTNMVKHNTGGGSSIRIGLDSDDGRLRIVLVDEDVDPWDPGQVPAVPLSRRVDERKSGGLGLHLVRGLADTIEYDFKDRRMQVTVIKKLEQRHVRGTTER